MHRLLIVRGGALRRMHGAATVVVVTTALLVAACSSGGHASAVGSASMAPPLTGTLTGTGSTFQFTFQQHAIARFRSAQPGIQVDYLGGGSGTGRADLAAGIVNFAGSDTAPIPASELPRFKGRTVLYFPVVIGPITVAYNLPDVSDLRLTGPVIAGIFQGTITRWSDPAIAAENPGVKLPSTAITIVHRSDSSGTTQNFSQFLVDSAPQVWKLGSSSMIHWPATSRSGAGNDGVASIIHSTPGAVGYVDFADAKAAGLTYALIKNQAGRYMLPSPTSASVAASQVKVSPNLTFSAIWAPGANSYPITYQSWVLIYAHQPDASLAKRLLSWIGFLLGDGQTLLLGLNYAPLPSNIDQMAARQLSLIEP
jgi:phosphate transport system substrate-binding protein